MKTLIIWISTEEEKKSNQRFVHYLDSGMGSPSSVLNKSQSVCQSSVHHLDIN
jgi:hypothetical protein